MYHFHFMSVTHAKFSVGNTDHIYSWECGLYSREERHGGNAVIKQIRSCYRRANVLSVVTFMDVQ